MKKLVLILVFFSFSFAKAQISFVRSDYAADGDKIIYGVDSPVYSKINFGSTGANHVWNFTLTNSPSRYDSSLFFASTGDPNAPGVKVNLLQRSISTGDQYAEVTDSFVKLIMDFPAYRVAGVKLKLFD